MQARGIEQTGDTVKFQIEATDNVGVESVTLYYGTDRFRTNNYQSVTMSSDGRGGSLYSTTVATTVGKQLLYYYIEVRDKASNVGEFSGVVRYR